MTLVVCGVSAIRILGYKELENGQPLFNWLICFISGSLKFSYYENVTKFLALLSDLQLLIHSDERLQLYLGSQL